MTARDPCGPALAGYLVFMLDGTGHTGKTTGLRGTHTSVRRGLPSAAGHPDLAADPELAAGDPGLAGGDPGLDVPAPLARRDAAVALFEELQVLARASGALDLRLARLVAWFRSQDLVPLGFSSYSAFCRERVPLCDSWLRDLVRLVESELDLVLAAVCRGELPLTVAVQAPALVDPGEQWPWLDAALVGDPTVLPRARRWGEGGGRLGPVPITQLPAGDRRLVHRARHRARLVAGRSLSDRQADRMILGAWRHQADGRAMIAAARLSPPPPPERDPPAWCLLPLAVSVHLPRC